MVLIIGLGLGSLVLVIGLCPFSLVFVLGHCSLVIGHGDGHGLLRSEIGDHRPLTLRETIPRDLKSYWWVVGGAFWKIESALVPFEIRDLISQTSDI